MKIRGNYILMFVVQFFGGILTYFACEEFGIMGVLYGGIPFILTMIAVQAKYRPDERELAIIYKTETVQGIFVAGTMAVVYIAFPQLNWFYVFVSAISVVRGVAGTVLFLRG